MWLARAACGMVLTACLACAPQERALRGDGAGRVSVAPDAPVAVESTGTWTLTYEAAGDGIGVGGAIEVRVWPEWGWTAPQIEDPSAPGFVSYRVLGSAATIEAARVPAKGTLYDAIGLRVTAGALAPGDRVEIEYRNGKAGYYAGEGQGFLVKTDADGDGSFARVEPSAGFEVLPGAPAHLWVAAPSEVRRGEEVRARVSVLDRWGNRIRTRGVVGSAPVVSARDEETGLSGLSGRIWPIDDDQELRVYWGDVHGHSGWSDGVGSPEAYFRYARDVSRLDFAALTDHDAVGPVSLDDERWARLVEITEEFHDPGRFVTLFGYEYTNWDTGHLTVLSPSAALPLVSAADPATDRVEELWERLAQLPDVPVLTIPHHSGGSTMPTDWRHFDPRFVKTVEIFSVHGSSECETCPGRVESPRAGSFVLAALLRGYPLAFIAAGDTHTGQPGRVPTLRPYRAGLAGVLAPELSREAIWDALVAGRTFATTGSRTVPQLEREGDRFRFHVRAADTLAKLEILKNGRVVHRLDVAAAEVRDAWRDPVPPVPGDFYYLRVTETDGHMAWTSPIRLP